MLSISIIIPAYNAAETLSATIESLLVQTYPHWELIVVNDGSTDQTGAIAEVFAQRDHRVRVIHQPNAHLSAARNTGIQAARFDWLLFNDADDWLADNCLEKMTAMLTSDPSLDVVHGGWIRVTQDGKTVVPKYAPDLVDMFPEFAYYCVFQLNACVIRKAAVEAVGGFDTKYISCADWDLLQRVARVGGHFAAVREVLSFYRMRPNSLSSNVQRVYSLGLEIIQTAHDRDPRIVHLDSDYKSGLSPETLSTHQFYFASWCAGLMLGQGRDAGALLDAIATNYPLFLEAKWIAENLFESIPVPTSQTFDQWHMLWSQHSQRIIQFTQAFERRTGINGLSEQILDQLARKILQHTSTASPLLVGQTYSCTIEVTNPIMSLRLPPAATRIYSRITFKALELGYLHLPTANGEVASWVIADAIASEFFWLILYQFFQHNFDGEYSSAQHDQIGWERFLQAITNQSTWNETMFYHVEAQPDTAATTWDLVDALVTIDITQPLPNLRSTTEQLTAKILLTIGGCPVGVVELPLHDQQITVSALRSGLLLAGELELCRLTVREAILGKPPQNGQSLHDRLSQNLANLSEPLTLDAIEEIILLSNRTAPS
jgi:glycosyltransferase involved in cell wall biosynthesis